MRVSQARRLFLFSFLSIGLVIGLTACTSTPDRVETPPKPGEQKALYGVGEWHLRGRVAVKVDDERWQASLTWRHAASQDQLRLAGPVGIGAVDVYLTKHYMRLVRANGEIEVSHNPDVLLQKTLGFPVPLQDLQYWVLGLPSLGSSEYQIIETYQSGRTKAMIQSGWRVSYANFREMGEWLLPGKVVVARDAARLVLVADEWNIDGSDY